MTAGSRTPILTEPFSWAGGDVGCLLVHGFTGTPYEMRFLGERLRNRGATVNGVRLAGHATDVADLSRSRWIDWYESVERGLDPLVHCGTIVAVGQSLGALLVLRLAFHRPERVQAVVLLSTALMLTNPWPARAARVGALARLCARIGFSVSKNGSDIADLEARRIHPGYDRMPLRSILELATLQREVGGLLPRVRQPVLVVHAQHDHTAPIDNVALLRQQLPNLRGTLILPRSFHVLSVDVEKEQVADAIGDFIAAVGRERAGAKRQPA